MARVREEKLPVMNEKPVSFRSPDKQTYARREYCFIEKDSMYHLKIKEGEDYINTLTFASWQSANFAGICFVNEYENYIPPDLEAD
jgi:hypothetical protein